MSRRLYSVRFAAQHAGSTATFVIPAGFRAVLRDVSSFNADAIAPGSAQLVHVDSSCTIYQRSLGPQVWASDELREVVEEGESVQVNPGSSVDMFVSGYLLSLP